MNIGDYAIPLAIAAILAFSVIKRKDAHSAFVSGAGEGIHTALGILPSLLALVTAVEIMRKSGLTDAIAEFISPLTSKIGLPSETVPLILLRPFSGSGAMAVVKDIFENSGPDSKPGFIASVLAGSTETTFYAVSLYYGSCGVKNIGVTLISGLAADLTAAVVSTVIANLIF